MAVNTVIKHCGLWRATTVCLGENCYPQWIDEAARLQNPQTDLPARARTQNRLGDWVQGDGLHLLEEEGDRLPIHYLYMLRED